MQYRLALARVLFPCFFALLVFLAIPVAWRDSAMANTLSATGGLQFGRNSGMNDLKNSNPLLGAAYSFALDAHFELGGFYDYNALTFMDGTTGSLAFMGAVIRYEQEHDRGLFADLKLGLGQAESSSTLPQTRSLPAFGVGAGYRFPISRILSAGPRVDLRELPVSPDSGAGRVLMTDFGLMLSIKLF